MSGGFYRAFEDRYRGSRDVIGARLAVYLPFVRPLVREGAAALDLGCGRGEWLELLTEAGFAAEGVDLDEGMLAACRERGLRVVNGDALAALRARPADSLAVVSAFHLVEHIAFEQVQELITEALRVLQPGGLLIMETPNPENLVVGTSSFYDDPSHLRPLPPKLLGFAVEFAGFGRHQVLRLQEPAHLEGAKGVTLFDVLAGVSPDYSVVAQKGGAPARLASLDPLFEARYGFDLHELAQRYQQGNDAVRGELDSVRNQQQSNALAVQQQLATLDTSIAQVHGSTVALVEQHAKLGANMAGFDERLTRLETAPRHTSDRLDAVEASLGRIDTIEASLQRLPALEERIRVLAQTASQQSGDAAATRLRARIAELETSYRHESAENARLAAHVAWIEGRLSHAESESAAVRSQLDELQRQRSGLVTRIVRGVRHGPRRLAGALSTRRLHQPASAFLRRLIQAVLRRPALKRLARSLVARFPRLHTRLLQLMYAPGLPSATQQVDADPLAAEMSPRSLSIYRALAAASKPKD